MPTRHYYKEARFDNFRTFCKVARLQSYAGAAQALGLSRPTIWQQIDSLQRELGVQLLARSGRGVQATEAGRLLLELVQPNVAAMDSLKQAFRARLEDLGGQLRVAAITGRELYETLGRFRARHPRIHLTLMERRSIDVITLVEEGQCDVGLALFSPEMPRSPLVHYEQVGQRSFMLITAPNHPLVRKRRLRLADVIAYPLILFPKGNPLRVQVERVFDREGLLPQMQVALETDNREISEHFAHRRLGVGIALVSPAQKPIVPVRFLPLADLFGSLPLCLLWEKGAHLLPHVAAFVEMVRHSLG
jgi:DNA-binding transcriptional LysR family regulator